MVVDVLITNCQVSENPKSGPVAIQTAITKASATLRGIGWFEVLSTRGHVEGGKIAHFQVTLKVGFTLE